MTYHRLAAQARACARCARSEDAVRQAFRLLALELAGRGVALELRMEDLDVSRSSEANTLSIDGWPLEHWLGASLAPRADLSGRDSRTGGCCAGCKALSLDGTIHETLSPELVARAVRRVL